MLVALVLFLMDRQMAFYINGKTRYFIGYPLVNFIIMVFSISKLMLIVLNIISILEHGIGVLKRMASVAESRNIFFSVRIIFTWLRCVVITQFMKCQVSFMIMK